jgi:hypothetical protein
VSIFPATIWRACGANISGKPKAKLKLRYQRWAITPQPCQKNCKRSLINELQRVAKQQSAVIFSNKSEHIIRQKLHSSTRGRGTSYDFDLRCRIDLGGGWHGCDWPPGKRGGIYFFLACLDCGSTLRNDCVSIFGGRCGLLAEQLARLIAIEKLPYPHHRTAKIVGETLAGAIILLAIIFKVWLS